MYYRCSETHEVCRVGQQRGTRLPPSLPPFPGVAGILLPPHPPAAPPEERTPPAGRPSAAGATLTHCMVGRSTESYTVLRLNSIPNGAHHVVDFGVAGKAGRPRALSHAPVAMPTTQYGGLHDCSSMTCICSANCRHA